MSSYTPVSSHGKGPVDGLELQAIAVKNLNEVELGRSNHSASARARSISGHSHSDHYNGSRGSSAADIRQRAPTFSPEAPEHAPTVLTFTNIKVTTRAKPAKVLLDDVSGSITGGFWAIMGASGGGKTTLLSTLSLRLDPNYMDISGEFRLNGREYSRQVLKAMAAYVMQDDLLHAELTVEETLYYAAQLRMASDISDEERESRIEELLALMGIAHCKKVIIGDTRRKGISGGERKRVSVAIELLNRPLLLFLDEPTSGLDSTTAFSVTKTLKQLTERGECTVVCTIHQPMPKIFRLFDNLILMKKGRIAYQGQAMKTVNFLEMIGHPCPQNVNLADHLLDVVAPSRTDVDKLDEHGEKVVLVDLSMGADKAFFSHSTTRSWWHEFSVLTRRNFQQYARRTNIILFNLTATIVIAVFIGYGFWHQIGTGQDSVAKRGPSLFFAMVNQGVVGSLQAVTTFPAERAIMLRERASGTYSTSSYFMAKTATDLVTLLWPPILFSLIVYFGVGYQQPAGKFFLYMMFAVLDTYAATSLSTLVVCTCISIERSTVVLSFLLEATRLFGGLYTSPLQLDHHKNWRFADALSYIKYAYFGIALNELHGLDYDCPAGTKCTYTTGEQWLAAMGFDRYTIGGCAGYLVLLIVGFRFLGYLGLRFIK